MNRSGRLLKLAPRFFMAFLASVFLFAFLILLTFRLTLFSESYLTKQAVKADYYSELTKEINHQIENSALGSNVPEGVLAKTVSENLVETDVNEYFKAMYNTGKKYSISNEKRIQASASQAIATYMEANELPKTVESEKAVEELADSAVTIYKGYIELPFLTAYGRKIMNYQNTLVIFMIICGVVWGGLSLALYQSLKGYFHRLLRFWAYICSASGLMMIVVPAVMLFQQYFKRLGIQSKAMYGFIQTYLNSFLWLFVTLGCVAIAVGIVFAVFSEIKRKQLFAS
ncbi:hypothetical protein GIX45_27195 [Erwinia sp. CPCC 100877]|nr:hypothetical protein [Erwinia sp. CPCC 100877]